MPIAVGQFTIYDFYDIQGSTAPPTNPVKDQVWLDTSLNPPVMKIWSGKEWLISNDYVSGFVNLLYNTGKMKTTEYWYINKASGTAGLTLVDDPEAGKAIKFNIATDVTSWCYFGNNSHRDKPFEVGQDYTISFLAKADNVRSLSVKFCTGGSNDTSIDFGEITLNTGWKRYEITAKAKAVGTENLLYMVAGGTGAKEIHMTKLKLETGNRASDWSAASEDLEKEVVKLSADLDITKESITQRVTKEEYAKDKTTLDSRLSTAEGSITTLAGQVSLKASKTEVYTKGETDGKIGEVTERVKKAEAEIKVNADSITQTVKKTDYNGETLVSMINQTADTIKISAKNINLNGAVTFSSFDSSTQNKINTIESTAGIAKSTADTAKSTATTAKTTADTAKSTADTAKSTADTAKSTASSAQTAANTANSKLDTWSHPTDKTTINGGKIMTGSITAQQIAAGAITADIIKSGTFIGLDFIAGGSGNDGSILTKDSTDKVVFHASKSGVYATNLTFADSITSSGAVTQSSSVSASGSGFYTGEESRGTLYDYSTSGIFKGGMLRLSETTYDLSNGGYELSSSNEMRLLAGSIVFENSINSNTAEYKTGGFTITDNVNTRTVKLLSSSLEFTSSVGKARLDLTGSYLRLTGRSTIQTDGTAHRFITATDGGTSYIEWFTDGKGTTRGGWLGYGSTSHRDMVLRNEQGSLLLQANGSSAFIAVNAPLNMAGQNITGFKNVVGYNNLRILGDHGNGNITISATGNNLYLGYDNTVQVRVEKPLYVNASETVIGSLDASGGFRSRKEAIFEDIVTFTGGVGTNRILEKGNGDSGSAYGTHNMFSRCHWTWGIKDYNGLTNMYMDARTGKWVGKAGSGTSSSRSLKSDIRAITSKDTPMVVNLREGETVDKGITVETITDFLDSIGIRTYAYDYQQEGYSQEDIPYENGGNGLLQLGFIADDVEKHPLFKYIGEKGDDGIHTIDTLPMITATIAGYQAEKKQRLLLEQRVEYLETKLNQVLEKLGM